MGNFKIISETPLTMVDTAEKLKKIEKRDGELTFRANKAKEYFACFNKLKPKQCIELKEKIEGLNIPRLKDKHIAKLIDIFPVDSDSVKIVLSNEPITVKEEDIKKIASVFAEYKK